MASRSVNKVILIGNLTRDPELRYTPQGHAVCSFGVATNREWKTDGEKQESTEFHNIVSWNKLAELCSQLLNKGSKVYLEGRLQTRDWVGDDNVKRYKTEIVIEEMVLLTSKRSSGEWDGGASKAVDSSEKAPKKGKSKAAKSKDKEEVQEGDEIIDSDEVPF